MLRWEGNYNREIYMPYSRHTCITLESNSQHIRNTLAPYWQHTCNTLATFSQPTQNTINTYSQYIRNTFATLRTRSQYTRNPFEKLFAKRLNKFIDKQNILNDSQYGFRHDHSTCLALIELIEQITLASDFKKSTVGILLT